MPCRSRDHLRPYIVSVNRPGFDGHLAWAKEAVARGLGLLTIDFRHQSANVEARAKLETERVRVDEAYLDGGIDKAL